MAKADLPCDRGLHFAGTTVPLGCAGKIATEVAPGKHAALVVDQAGWHLSARLVVPDNITLGCRRWAALGAQDASMPCTGMILDRADTPPKSTLEEHLDCARWLAAWPRDTTA